MIAARRVVQRNALVYKRVWRGSLFSSFVQPTLFLFALGMGVGTMVDAGGAGLPGGVTYAEFLAPGLLAAAAMQAAAFESSYPVLGKMTWDRNYEAITATPLRVADLVLGELAWIGIRLITIAVAFIAVMSAFGIPRSPLVLLAVPAVVLTGLAFAAPVVAYAATLKTSSTFNVMFRFIITPLFLFSGVFFPIGRLPHGLERAAWATPLFHGVQLVRGLTLGTVPAAWAFHVAYLAGMTCAGILLALFTFRRRLYA
jgi:lipooligosaccharide transport system permease protein